jgi:hypothetical protein
VFFVDVIIISDSGIYSIIVIIGHHVIGDHFNIFTVPSSNTDWEVPWARAV